MHSRVPRSRADRGKATSGFDSCRRTREHRERVIRRKHVAAFSNARSTYPYDLFSAVGLHTDAISVFLLSIVEHLAYPRRNDRARIGSIAGAEIVNPGAPVLFDLGLWNSILGAATRESRILLFATTPFLFFLLLRTKARNKKPSKEGIGEIFLTLYECLVGRRGESIKSPPSET